MAGYSYFIKKNWCNVKLHGFQLWAGVHVLPVLFWLGCIYVEVCFIFLVSIKYSLTYGVIM